MARCPRCGTEVKEPVKTWQLVSPLPDSEGRITITVMGTFVCPNCGYRWRGKVSILKVGPDGTTEILEPGKRGKRKRRKEKQEQKPKEEGTVIEIDISDIYDEL
jgi:DNA-directed RNA polymerase subunit RPC12/RpoP